MKAQNTVYADSYPVALALLLWLIALPLSAHAQKSTDDKQSTDKTDSEQASSTKDVTARMAELERALKQQQAKLAELQAFKDETEEKEATEEFAALSEAVSAEELGYERWFKVYGFFDLRFSKGFWKDDALYNIPFGGTTSSFLMTSVNLYIQSQMTKNLGAIVELQFSYVPMGEETEWEYVAKLPNGGEITQGEYERRYPLIVDPATSAFFTPGGVNIERAHFSYTPIDWFNVIAGRFLTPYGIWNLDHGAPTILPVLTPWLLVRNGVPNAQTGVQVYGRAFFRYDLYLDYAITVTNGRHWYRLDAIQDFDENKALGLRLRLSYEGRNFSIAGGGYGYIGKSTDIERTITMAVDSNMILDKSVYRPIRSEVDYTIKAMEYVATADLLIKLYDFTLQNEFYSSRFQFSMPPVLETNWGAFSGVPITQTVYYASYISMGYYSLLSWELPLEEWISPVRITPYVMYEFSQYNDNIPWANYNIFVGGVNLKPSPFVVLKAEYMHAVPEAPVYGEPMRLVQLQLAVSF